jgi:hypothetical protein
MKTKKARATIQSGSTISNKASCEVSANTKMSPDPKVEAPIANFGIVVGKAWESPYFRETACDGSKNIHGELRSVPPFTQSDPSGDTFTVPLKLNLKPGITPLNAISTLLDSKSSFSRKRLASSREMSAPVPCEDMFMLLVRLCG